MLTRIILRFLFQIPLLVKLFDKLYSLTNLLVVQPENLKQVCSEEQLVRLYAHAVMHTCTRALFVFALILSATLCYYFVVKSVYSEDLSLIVGDVGFLR